MVVKQNEEVGVGNPLAPLSAEEIAAAVETVRKERGLKESAKFVSVELYEPSKEAVLAGTAGLPREAFMVIRERAERATYEAVVDITARTVVSWRQMHGVQPSVMLAEFFESEEAIRNDPRWQEAMRKRRVSDFNLAIIDPWPAGYYGPDDDPGKSRLIRALTWVRTDPHDNGYARPVEGLITLFDLDTMQVVDIEDHGVVPLPPASGNYSPETMRDPNNVPHVPALRTGLKPLEIVQPEGPSFEIDNNELRWQKWRLRIGWTPQERLRRRGVRARHAGQQPHAGLRLPGRDPLPRRRDGRQRWQAVDDPERHLHPRGGRRHSLEAFRLPHRGFRGAPLPPSGHLVHRHGGQL